ncbi:MAG: helix-turn-helix domain-containing protein, partial [Pseudomonadota bacterium]
GYTWPGNVRELENVVERAVVMARGDRIRPDDLPTGLMGFSVTTHRPESSELATLEEQEKAYISWVLKQTEWNKTRAAEILGIDRVSLWRKIKRLGIEP